jgi:hypothetical protein
MFPLIPSSLPAHVYLPQTRFERGFLSAADLRLPEGKVQLK